jgi:integrase
MAGKRWTDERVKAERLPDGKTERRILVEYGLYLHVRRRKSGGFSKHWQFRAQVNGSRRWLTIGEYPAISLAAARAELLKHQATQDAAKKGMADHPAIAARASRKNSLAQPTVEFVFDELLAEKRLGSSRKRGEPVRERTIKILTDNYNADIGARISDAKVALLTPELLRECVKAPLRRGSPGSAAHVYRTLRGIVNFAIKRGYITGPDPMRGIENPRPYRPQPPNAANDSEIAALLHYLDQSRLWLATRLAIEFQLVTGARPGDVRLAEWKEFSIERTTWTIPAERFKSNRPVKVHLSKAALNVLSQVQAVKRPHGAVSFVFPGALGGPMEKMAVARALSRLLARFAHEGCPNQRPHDLRRTFRTLLARIGIEPHIAELCLGHVEKETMRRVYDGHDYSRECAAAWERAGEHISWLRSGGADVIPLIRRA